MVWDPRERTVSPFWTDCHLSGSWCYRQVTFIATLLLYDTWLLGVHIVENGHIWSSISYDSHIHWLLLVKESAYFTGLSLLHSSRLIAVYCSCSACPDDNGGKYVLFCCCLFFPHDFLHNIICVTYFYQISTLSLKWSRFLRTVKT